MCKNSIANENIEILYRRIFSVCAPQIIWIVQIYVEAFVNNAIPDYN